jgi:hypothetical protein
MGHLPREIVEGSTRCTHEHKNENTMETNQSSTFMRLCHDSRTPSSSMRQQFQQCNSIISLLRGRDSLSDAFLEILQRSFLQSLHLLFKLLGAFLGSAQDLIPRSKGTGCVLRANMLSTRNLALHSWSDFNQDVDVNAILCGSRWEKYRLHSRP